MNPGETVLQAALRHGIEFPNSCRAGGCGTCKCRLTAGKVKELTETGYLLTADEIDQGYILACQSVPRSDIGIAVDISSRPSQRSVRGRVVVQRKLTHDITRLGVQLDEPMPYKAGQFANLGIEGLDGVVRSYSFAAPARDDGQVSFFVRRVPGGRFSSLVNDHDILGRSVRVDGPSGDFWLRPSDAPLLLVAGGSGLAPILAILQDALSAGVARSVTLLFGAREARDLYALEEIASIARQWHGAFRFVPVLSAAADDATWTGERGLVTEKIPGLLEPGSHALLCGPPAMIDGAIALLLEQGVPRERIHFDRFTTQADVAAPVEAAEDRPVSALHYLKYFAVYGVGLLCVLALVAGGWFLIAGLLAVLAFYLIGDAVSGDDTSAPTFRHPGVLTVQLWMALPLLALIVFVSVWTVSPGDPLGFGTWVRHWTGYDVLAARDAGTFIHHLFDWVVAGLMIGLVGTIPAHELTHRTWDRTSMLIGRWLLAFSFDTTFAIEHVYGHHRYVSTVEDPATAPRGRNVYAHIVASTIRGNISAWHIEMARLRKRRLGRLLLAQRRDPGAAHERPSRRPCLRHGWLEGRDVLHDLRALGQGAARDRQLHGALRHGAESGDAGAAAALLEHQPAHQLVDHVQPDATLPPSRSGRSAVSGSQALSRRSDDDQRLSRHHHRRDDSALVAQARDAEGAGVGSRLRNRRGAEARGRRQRPQRHPRLAIREAGGPPDSRAGGVARRMTLEPSDGRRRSPRCIESVRWPASLEPIGNTWVPYRAMRCTLEVLALAAIASCRAAPATLASDGSADAPLTYGAIDEPTVKAMSHALFDAYDRADVDAVARALEPTCDLFDDGHLHEHEALLDEVRARRDRHAPSRTRKTAEEHVYLGDNSAVFIGETIEHYFPDGPKHHGRLRRLEHARLGP